MQPRDRRHRLPTLALLVSVLLLGCQGRTMSSDRPPDGSTLSLRWTYDSGAPINQVPLRVGGVVAVVPAGGPLTALDALTGQLRWEYSPQEGVWERAYATDGDQIFVGTGGGGLVALEAETGEIRWRQDLGIEVQLPPLVEHGRLFVPTTFVGPGLQNDHQGRARLFVLDARRGNLHWSFESGNYILQTPAVRGDDLYVAGNYLAQQPVEEGGHMRLYALRASDGSLRWTYESEDGFPKRLYVGEETVAFVGYQDFVSGIDTADGRLRWRRDTGNWVPSLTGVGEALYFGSANTIVHALDAASGEILWQHNIEHGTFNYVLGAPAPVQEQLITLTQHGDIMALEAATGALLWTVSTGTTSRVGLAVGSGWIYLGDQDGVVYAYSDR